MSVRRLALPVHRTRALAIAVALAAAASTVVAQRASERDAPAQPADSSGSFEVGGIDVDVAGPSAEAARLAGWREAQRRGWAMLSARLTGRPSRLSDSALDGLVAGVIVESEAIGPRRYVARLGVLFDRGRAGAVLGVSGRIMRSPPMLLIPLAWTAGTGRTFERPNPWASAWSRFRSGNSAIDYVRPAGNGADGMLMNAGQVLRRGRGWWRQILDQYGASDVLVPEVRLYRRYPGGPITGVFSAHHGPDYRLVTRFTLRVEDGNALDALLDAGARRIDAAYQAALRSGVLRQDRLLAYRPPAPQAVPTPVATASASVAGAATETAAATTQVSIQFDTPGVAQVTSAEASLRGIPGVSSATTTSLALGGVSVMRVGYSGDLASLRAALEARGWQVQEGAGVLRIRRSGGITPPAPPPPASPGNASEE